MAVVSSDTCCASCSGNMLLSCVQVGLTLLHPPHPPQQGQQLSQGSVVAWLLLHQLLQLLQCITVLLLHGSNRR